jgi:branched-chain amino acid transport system ATP-binding protein
LNAGRALSLVQRAYVLESREMVIYGASGEFANDGQVQAVYLGI